MKPYLIVIGTFLPFIGVFVTLYLGLILSGQKQWLALFLTPLAILLLCLVFGRQIGSNGNMAFAGLLVLYMIGLVIYYPILILCALISWAMHKKTPRQP